MREPPLILASGSPRRRRLLQLIGLDHRVEPAALEPTPDDGERGVDFALRAASAKAGEVARRHPDGLVLGADTVVELGDAILGKPTSPQEAVAMLLELGGATHQVHTGVALVADGQSHRLVDSTRVRMAPVTEAQAAWYVATGEPMDKAGAYAVQGIGGLLVESIEGSPHTVVGLPIHRLHELFTAAGRPLLERLRPPTRSA